MRRVSFNLKDRAVLTGVELVQSLKYAIFVIPLFLLLGFIRDGGLHVSHVIDALPFIGAVVTGAFLVPILLPWIPGKAFSFKGWFLGVVYAAFIGFFSDRSVFSWISSLLVFPAISAFVSLNFTGATTFTSLSGVEKEIRISAPLIAVSFAAGIVVTVIGFFN
jgi:hypothetical protein